MKRWYILILSIFFIFFLVLDSVWCGQKKILTIHSYSSNLLWTTDQEEGIKKTLGSDSYQYFHFYMDTKEIPRDLFQSKAAEALAFYEKTGPDLVFLTDDNALKFSGPLINKTTPIVFSGINGQVRTDYPWILKQENITGVLERPMIKRTLIVMINALNLNTGKILVLMGESTTGTAFFLDAFEGKKHFDISGEKVDVIMTGHFEDWKTIILSAQNNGYDLIMPIANYHLTDSEEKFVPAFEVARWVAANSPIPIITIHKDQIGKDMALGGVVLSGIYMGEDAASLAKQILESQISPASLGFKTHQKEVVIFSRQQLERWKLKLTSKYRAFAVFID